MKSRRQKAWTKADVASLTEEYNSGRAIVYIAMKLDRTPASIKHEIRALHDKGELRYRDDSWGRGNTCKEVKVEEGLPMSDEEIRRRHKNAINPQEHITILAQCNGCSRSRIEEILNKDGAE